MLDIHFSYFFCFNLSTMASEIRLLRLVKQLNSLSSPLTTFLWFYVYILQLLFGHCSRTKSKLTLR